MDALGGVQDTLEEGQNVAADAVVNVLIHGDIAEQIAATRKITVTDAERDKVLATSNLASLLEVPAARLAAERRANDDVTRLRQCIHDSGPTVDASVELAHNTDFHAIVLATSGNTLLAIAAQPVFNVLMTGFTRSSLGTRFHQAVRRQHRDIADAIDSLSDTSSGSSSFASGIFGSAIDLPRYPTPARESTFRVSLAPFVPPFVPPERQLSRPSLPMRAGRR